MLSATSNVIEGRYHADLMVQPEALQRSFDWLRQPSRWRNVQSVTTARAWRRVVLAGMGSSFHGLHPLNLALIGAGFTPVMMESSELIHYGMPLCDENTLVVAVSQSGGSAEILRFLELNRHATVLAVTNTATSRLATDADCTLLTQAGLEYSVSCKTYVCSLLALQWLAGVFTGADELQTLRRLAPAPALVDAYLRHWASHTEALAHRLSGLRHLFLVGRGDSLAAAGTGALIIKESARLHAEGMSSAAFRHGPMEMLQPDMAIAVLEGAAPARSLNLRLVRELRDRGLPCDVIGASAAQAALRLPACDALLTPILEILPVEMMTLALAGLAGREAGVFEKARKITDTE